MAEHPIQPDGPLRLLVTIACYGDKNLELLKQIIRAYQGMAMQVDIVVVSDGPKELGPGVEVVVGLPSDNPWSLPFAHKPILARNAERYDLFIYSEDDMLVTEANIRAFLRVTPSLAPDEIAGFLRYEVDGTGRWSLPEAHGTYHWKPESARRRGDLTVAEFTNEHAAFYILTRAQLERAIASGGFLRAPYEGRYDMLCTAATDPYTSCGFRKVVCVSDIDDFLIHHCSNRYAGQLGVPLPLFRDQVEALIAIARGVHPAIQLCRAESHLSRGEWSKSYYENPSEELLRLIPDDAKSILSIGCGWGEIEARLMERGAAVTALPLDSVIGAAAALRGIEVLSGELGDCFKELGDRIFDSVVMTNLLHLLPNPSEVIDRCARLVGHGGTLVVSGPNFRSVRVLAKRLLGIGDSRRLRSYEESGIHTVGPWVVRNQLKKLRSLGLEVDAVTWTNRRSSEGFDVSLGRLDSVGWVLQARRRVASR